MNIQELDNLISSLEALKQKLTIQSENINKNIDTITSINISNYLEEKKEYIDKIISNINSIKQIINN